MNLNKQNWKEFRVASVLNVYNGKGITKAEIEENPGEVLAIQSGEEDNGVIGKISKEYCEMMNYTLSEKMCLTVARSGSAGFVSFQVEGCVVGDSAKMLLFKYDSIVSIENYLFLQTILLANRFKYAYGRKVTEEKYMNDCIKLPIQHNSNGSAYLDSNCQYSKEGYVPDWEFMKSYIRSLNCKQMITNNRFEYTPELSKENWKEFRLHRILYIEKGQALSAEDKEEYRGTIPCVNGTIGNNGVLCYLNKDIEDKGFKLVKAPALSLVRVGNGGITRVQMEDFYVADNAFSVHILFETNVYILLFISAVLNKESFKYSYGRTITRDKYLSTIIKLPVQYNSAGMVCKETTCQYSEEGYIPDWKFMENYIRTLPFGDKIES